jgi:hypothetical protein
LAFDGTPLKHDAGSVSASISQKEPTMRKLVFSMGVIAFAFLVAFAWSHTVLAPSQASTGTSINPTDMMTNYKISLPIEQWEAI